MSGKSLVDIFGKPPRLVRLMGSEDVIESMPEIKTYFRKYRNPIGIEIEVEGVGKKSKGEGDDEGIVKLKDLNFWYYKSDGSLKIAGREYISYPLSGRQVDYALWEIEKHLTQFPSILWSHRTSIHVHQNVSSFNMEQLVGYTMLYGLFEDMFFSMVNDVRKGNPYCYHARDVHPDYYAQLHDENKYCALNLYPVKSQCTVEFRHMQGTDDFRLIRRWIQLIVKLHYWIDNHEDCIQIIKDKIKIQSFSSLAKDVFGANVMLFSEDLINSSCRAGAMWALIMSNKEFS